ncbi:hypothetical protein [Ideonella sp. A 288]|uniref:hypothetical protein n=1 Tax=Ideonella sp. A 288 TaxID=1962181 RepID=UPI000B4A9DDC|nr:hypothetical protein [Ideonella sp. A 288]
MKAEHCLRFDVRALARQKLLNGAYFTWQWTSGRTGEPVGSISVATTAGGLHLRYSHNGDPKTDFVATMATPCTYGGSRAWFCCPLCARRVAVLYMVRGRFMCRNCGNLTYASKSDDAIGRAWRLQWKLEGRLDKGGRRPKGMHHRTYRQLQRAIMLCEAQRDDALVQAFGRMFGGRHLDKVLL